MLVPAKKVYGSALGMLKTLGELAQWRDLALIKQLQFGSVAPGLLCS